jgi:hypothetical protein
LTPVSNELPLTPAASCFAFCPVEGAADCHGVEPRSEGGADDYASVQKLKKALLGGVLGIGGILEDTFARRVHHARMTRHNLAKRVWVSLMFPAFP